MRRIILLVFCILLVVSYQTAYGLLVTDNTDKDKFQYEVTYRFASSDFTQSMTAAEVPAISLNGTGQSNPTRDVFYTVVPRDGKVVGMSVAARDAITSGSATFDVTINGLVTGVQTLLEDAPVTTVNARTALGTTGGSGTTWSFIRQDRNDTNAARGFRTTNNSTNDRHNADNPFGRATPISAGNRIGVRVTTSSGLYPLTNAYTVTVYVLE